MNLDRIPPQPLMSDNMAGRYMEALRSRLATPQVHDTRACPDCGRPQHYTGTEYGWAHDAVVDLMRCCASPELLAEMEKCWRRDGHA